jgi:DNA replication factor GINS
MDLDELRSAQSRERQGSQLQHLRDGFYEEAASFIRGLRTERERVSANSEYSFPYDDPEVQRLTNEIQTAEEVVESLYERRVGKVVKMASFDAAGMAVDAEGLTAEESDLFETLVGDIEANRGRVLDALAGTTSSDGPEGTGTEAPAPGTPEPGDRQATGDRAGDDDAPTDRQVTSDRTGGDANPTSGDAAPGRGDADTADPAAADEPVHIGSGPAADGPVSTADETPPHDGESAPTPTPDGREDVGSTAADPGPAPGDEGAGGDGGHAPPPDATGTGDAAGDAMDAASAMGGNTRDASRSDDVPGGVPDGASDDVSPPDAPPVHDASGEASPGTTSGVSDTAPTADAAAETDSTAGTAGTDTGDGHQPVPPADGPPGADPGRAADAAPAEPRSDTGSETDPTASDTAPGTDADPTASDTAPGTDADPTAPATDAAEPTTQSGGHSGDADPVASGVGDATASAESSSDSRTLVRVTADVGEIFGVDGRAYDLAAGDVATLPADNAAPLVEDGDAEALQTDLSQPAPH